MSFSLSPFIPQNLKPSLKLKRRVQLSTSISGKSSQTVPTQQYPTKGPLCHWTAWPRIPSTVSQSHCCPALSPGLSDNGFWGLQVSRWLCTWDCTAARGRTKCWDKLWSQVLFRESMSREVARRCGDKCVTSFLHRWAVREQKEV
jgi:hypothetical protein